MYEGDSDQTSGKRPIPGTALMRRAAMGVMSILRPILALLGVFLIIVGIPIAMMTPIPFVPIGLPIVILGTVLLARNSLAGKRWMQSMLKKYPNLARFAPNWLLRLILGDDSAKT